MPISRQFKMQTSYPPKESGRLQLLQPIKITAEEAAETLELHDLEHFSNFLANEMSYKSFQAAWEPSGWYRDQVGRDLCSDAQASLLRQMTIKRCGEGPKAEAEILRLWWSKLSWSVSSKITWCKSWWSHSGVPIILLDIFTLTALMIFIFFITGFLYGKHR